MNVDRIEYAKYRIESANKTFQAAKVLAENGFWNSAVNRLYYSVFYAINALLVLHKIQAKSHSATKTQFSLHFIKTRKLDKKYGQLFAQLFDWRQKGDYESIFEYDQDSVNPLFDPVEEMINVIKKEVEKEF